MYLMNSTRGTIVAINPVFHLAIFFAREQAKSECHWVVMSSVFVASQSIKLLYLTAAYPDVKRVIWCAVETPDSLIQPLFSFRNYNLRR